MLQRSVVLIFLLFCACKKYKDPEPITDSRIKNKYCNDPNAVNYNWDFPGVPDNSVCIYPAQVFSGDYLFYDTATLQNGEYISHDSFFLSLQAIDSARIKIIGFCGADFHTARANRYFQFVMDSIKGNGQVFCNNKDTIAGIGSKSGIQDTFSMQMVYQIQSDTGISYHKGTAIKN